LALCVRPLVLLFHVQLSGFLALLLRSGRTGDKIGL
jgi:hypothetical protein